MEKKDYADSYRDRHRCFECAHYYFNNGEGTNDGCRAFPDGIPNNAHGGYSHKKVMTGQVGDFVYRKVTYDELCPFAKYLYDLRNSSK